MTIEVRLRVESGGTPGDVAVPRPRLGWRTTTDRRDWRQASAELELVGAATAVIQGDAAVLVDWPFDDLEPHARHRIRVRVTGADGATSPWSDPVDLRPTFLAPGEWQARFLELADQDRDAQPVLVRAEFDVRADLVRATLFATALGVYQAFVNGRAIDDQLLKPGWTPYRDRLIHESTDVTGLMRAGGRNALGFDVAGGWYTERWFRPQARYGAQPAVAGQLRLEYADGTVDTVATDWTWRAAPGPTTSSGLYKGEHHDARLEQDGWSETGFDDSRWVGVRYSRDATVPEARTAPAVRAMQEVPVAEVVTTPSGRTVLDFGQNLVGWVRVTARGEAGRTITLRHAEVLEHGELGTRPLRSADATDTMTLRGDPDGETWHPRHTFHGFRYVEVSGIDPADVDLTAVVVHSDMPRTGWFGSSHALLDRLHENVVQSMRGNFLALPTDCPQRDERLGWTGDIQVFSPTASFLYDTDAFLSSWLVDLAVEQERAGSGVVPFVVPNVIDDATTPAAAWGDAATVVPSVLHERFGDTGVLRRQLDSMRGWTDLILGLAGPSGLWRQEFQFGDWLDPAAPPEDAGAARTAKDVVATAYVIRSADLTASAATTLGEDALAEHYRAEAERIRAAFLGAFMRDDGTMTSDAQTAYALAIVFDIARDPALRARLGDRLAALVAEEGHRIGTGFVGTPIVTDALTATGHLDTAARLLLQTASPSWLHPVTLGATTVWERWDSMLDDGSINPGEMTSFNHYALGAVADWLHRTVAGLAPAEPGYRRVLVAPRPIDGLDHACAEHDGPYGRIRVAWRRTPAGIEVEAEVPPNSTAEVRLPGASGVVEVGSGAHRWLV